MTSPVDKTLIIGATGGIGQAVARRLAGNGCGLILCGRHLASLQQLTANFPNSTEPEVLVADITTEAGRQAISARTEKNDVNTLINISGINELVSFAEQTSESIERIIDTNLTANMLLTRAIIASVDKQRRLSVINVGSTLGAIGMPGYVTYCASKFALRGFSEALSRELSDTGIRIKYFAPRTTKTTMNSDVASGMNAELGNKADSTEVVASQLLTFVNSDAESKHLGWPEKFFVKLNAVFPSLVSQNFHKKLPIIRKYIG